MLTNMELYTKRLPTGIVGFHKQKGLHSEIVNRRLNFHEKSLIWEGIDNKWEGV